MIEYQELVDNGLISPVYNNILLELNKQSPNVLHSEWICRYGLLTEDKLAAYYNTQITTPAYKFKSPNEINAIDINLDNILSADKNNRLKFQTACFENHMFPYTIKGNIVYWLVSEEALRGDTAEEIETINTMPLEQKLKILYEGYNDILLTIMLKYFKPELQDVFTHVFHFTLQPTWEEQFRIYSKDRNLGFSTAKLYKIEGSFLADIYLAKAIEKKASDIYIDPKSNGIQISYSILTDYVKDAFIQLDETRIGFFLSRILTLTGTRMCDKPTISQYNKSITNFAKQDGRYEGRVNVIVSEGKENIVIRILDGEKKAIPFDKLKIRESRKNIIRNIFHNNTGLFVITGGPGSGKSTTANSCVTYAEQIHKYRRIETVENPIEQRNEGVCQLSLENTNLSYWDISESLTRRAGSILYIGELNSPEVVEFAIRCVQQNYLVITTLHTESVKDIIDRVRLLCVNKPAIYHEFLHVLRGVLHQRMLKQVCPNCMEHVDITSYEVTNDMTTVLSYFGYHGNTVPIAKPKKNCPYCEGRGFLIYEPIIATEILQFDEYVRTVASHMPIEKVGLFLQDELERQQLTGIHDALNYMREQLLDWYQIWDKYALCDKVSTCVAYKKNNGKLFDESFNIIKPLS